MPWFNKTQEYFHLYNITTNEEKIKNASICLEGTTYNWYLWWKGRFQSHNWNSFKNDFLKILGPLEKIFFFKTHQITTKTKHR
jgi:hypothetical protein